jgi:hypothetical protein
MAETVTLAPLTSLTNDTSAIATINANSQLIETAFADCLSLSGSSPNAMTSNLDMNNNQILNLPSPATINSPARLIDIVANPTLALTIPPVGTSGAVVGLLNGNNTYSGTSTFTGAVILPATTSITNVSASTVIFNGSSSGTTTVQASAIASGVLTLPATTDTLIGKATTDTLTNKTFDTAGTGNIFKVNGTQITAITGTGSTTVNQTSPTITTPNITGVTTASNATAGSIGEVISSTIAVGSAVSVTTSTPLNITNITLTAGDWDVYGSVNYLASAAAQVQHSYMVSLTTSSATIDLTGGRTCICDAGGDTYTAAGLATLLTVVANVGPVRFNVSGSTQVFLNGQSTFTTSGTQTAYGIIYARRIR